MKPTLHLLWTSPNHKLQQVPNKPASLDGNEDYSVDEFCERKTSIQRDDYDENKTDIICTYQGNFLPLWWLTNQSIHCTNSSIKFHFFFHRLLELVNQSMYPPINFFHQIWFSLSLSLALTFTYPCKSMHPLIHSFNAVLVFVKDHSCMELQRQASLKFIQLQLLQKMFG